jgi:hypothetical protein
VRTEVYSCPVLKISIGFDIFCVRMIHQWNGRSHVSAFQFVIRIYARSTAF